MDDPGDPPRTRILPPDELRNRSQPLLEEVRNLLLKFSDGDEDLLWALRRKLRKQLDVEEKGRQRDIRELKAFKRGEQGDRCAICKGALPEKGSVLDRFDGMKPYTRENTRLLCPSCDAGVQAGRGYR